MIIYETKEGKKLTFSKYEFNEAEELITAKGKAVKIQTNANGRHTATLTDDDGKQRTVLFARLKYSNLVGIIDYRHDIDHKDGNPENDEIENLQEITEAHNRSKKDNKELTEEDPPEYFETKINGKNERFEIEKKTAQKAKPVPAISERQRLTELVREWKEKNMNAVKYWLLEREGLTEDDVKFNIEIKRTMGHIWDTLNWEDLWAYLIDRHNRETMDRETARRELEEAKKHLGSRKYLQKFNIYDRNAFSYYDTRRKGEDALKYFKNITHDGLKETAPNMVGMRKFEREYLRKIFNKKITIMTYDQEGQRMAGRVWLGTDDPDEAYDVCEELTKNGLTPYIYGPEDFAEILPEERPEEEPEDFEEWRIFDENGNA